MIKTLKAAAKDIFLYFWPSNTRNKIVRLGVLIAIVVGIFIFSIDKTEQTESIETDNRPVVQIGTAADFSTETSASFIGTVRAVSEAQIQTEVSGRVTSVRVSAGDEVTAGSIIATLENAAEQAAVLQAEGVYESALAAAAVNDVSVTQAATDLRTTKDTVLASNRDAFTSVRDLIINTIDTFYSNPDSGLIGLRISAGNQTINLNNTREEFRTLIPEWEQIVQSSNIDSDLNGLINLGQDNTAMVRSLVSDLLAVVSSEENEDVVIDGVSVEDLRLLLTTAESSLNTTQAALDAASTNLLKAEESLNQAELGGTTNDISAANAQVKQALGSLRSAQASLANTILRTPITGTVNSLSVNTGDFIGSFTPIAEVANNGALEISIFVGESDRSTLTIGDTVEIQDSITGIVTNIAPAIDPETLKTEVKIATESDSLTHGEYVAVKNTQNGNSTADTESEILVPITAVKFTVDDGFIFIVEDGALQSIPVLIGAVRGSSVVIKNGIDRDTLFVRDARGLSAGQSVLIRD